MSRHRGIRAAVVGLLAACIGLVTNYASEFGPGWSRNPWVVFPVLVLLVVAAIGMAVATASEQPEPVTARRVTTLPATDDVGSLRPPSLDFTVRGREKQLADLRELVRRPSGKLAVVSGPGGTGKSSVAAELAARTRGTVWWVDWRGPRQFAAQLQDALDVPDARPDTIWSALAGRSRWLLVIDNVDHPIELALLDEPVSRYRGWVRPCESGLVLVTSRDTDPQTWGAAAELIVLEPLPVHDGAAVLLDAAPGAGTSAQAEELANRLGGFPLALRAAGRAIAQPTARHHSFDDYRTAVDDRAVNAVDLLRSTWDLSLDQLAEEGHPLARPLLRMLSLTADVPLPRNLVTGALMTPVSGREVSDAEVDTALAGLHRYGLVLALDGPVRCVSLHSLIREINASAVAERPDAPRWRDALDQALLVGGQEIIAVGRPAGQRAALLAPHLAEVLRQFVDRPDEFESARDVLDLVNEVLDQVGDEASQLFLQRAVLTSETAVFGADHDDTQASRNNLAVTLSILGDHHQAAQLHRENLAIREPLLGADDESTLISRHNLAETIRELGRHEEAASLLRAVLTARERVLGPDHPATAGTRHNLGLALSQLGDHGGAALHLHRAVQSGSGRPQDVLASRRNLATNYAQRGKYDQAFQLAQEVLADSERALGPDHPETLHCRAAVSAIYYDLGDRKQGLALHRRCLADYERVLGPEHPMTRHCREALVKHEKR